MSFGFRNTLYVVLMAVFVSGCFQDKLVEGSRVDIVDRNKKSAEGRKIKLPIEVNKVTWGGPIIKALSESQNYSLNGTIEPEWVFESGVGTIIASPVSYDKKLYVLGTNGLVKCIDLQSKQELWNFSIHPNSNVKKRIIGGGLSFDSSGSLYITSSLGELVSISLESGALNWRFKSEAPILDRVTVADKSIFVTDTSGVSRSFSLNGELNWSVEGQGSKHIRSKIGRPVVLGDLLLLPSAGGVLNAVNAQDGSEMWSFDFTTQRVGYAQNTFGAFNGDPGVFSENIYYGSVDGQFNALNRFGESIWQKDVGLQGSPLAVSNSIFFISDRNELVRLDKNNGDRIWSTIVKNTTGLEHYFTPILAGSKLWLTGTDNFLRSFDVETGLLKDQIIIKSSSTGPPIYYSGSIIVYVESGELIAFR